jgi:hypothetical protein
VPSLQLFSAGMSGGVILSVQKDVPRMSSARSIALNATVLTALVLSAMDYSAAQPNAAAQDVDWLSALADAETLSAARLSVPEQTKIFEQIERTSFDVPDSWSMELRARKISLGKLEGLVVRGTRLLCGATGNCETWVFRRTPEGWVNMLDGEAPIAASLGFVRQNVPVRDLVLTANLSASRSDVTRYTFDGRFYHRR